MFSVVQIAKKKKKDKVNTNDVEQGNLQLSCQDNFIRFCLVKYWGGVKDVLY